MECGERGRYITEYKNILIIISQMSTGIGFKLTRLNEKKCNFCFQWCETPQPVTTPLLCCQNCYEDFLINGLQLQNTQGETFNLLLTKCEEIRTEEAQPVKGQLECLMNYDVQETFMRWSRIQSLFEDNDFTSQEIETIQEQIEQFHRGYEEEKENLVEFIKNMNHSKSKSSLFGSTEENAESNVYQSLLQNRKENQINEGNNCPNAKQSNCKPRDKMHRLEDYCKNLGATRFVKRYQYYFDTSEIKRYKEVAKPLKTREFGYELSPNCNDFSSTKESNGKHHEFHKIKFNRSAFSQASGDKPLKLSEEQLKGKILSYLQPRSQSVTMTRLMATFVREAYMRTNLQPSMIELISFRVSSMDLQCYFNLFDLSSIQTLKFVNVGLSDQQLLTILDLIGGKVQRLVLTGNCLTENALPMFLGRSLPHLRQLYLGKNRISKYRMKENISDLRSRFILYL